MARIYRAGRPTIGWRRGERVTRLTQLRKGTRIICVSHKHKCENLAVVTVRYPHLHLGIKDDQILYAAWATGRSGKRTGEPEFAIWHYELARHHNPGRTGEHYFIAVKERT